MSELQEVVSRFNEICSNLVKGGKEVKCKSEVLFSPSDETVVGIRRLIPSGFELQVSVAER